MPYSLSRGVWCSILLTVGEGDSKELTLRYIGARDEQDEATLRGEDSYLSL